MRNFVSRKPRRPCPYDNEIHSFSSIDDDDDVPSSTVTDHATTATEPRRPFRFRKLEPDRPQGSSRPATPAPPVYLEFDADEDYLAEVNEITPALVDGTKVTTSHVSDHWHLLVHAVNRYGTEVCFLTSRRGLMAITQIKEEAGKDSNGHSVIFNYTTDVPSRVHDLHLSISDRKRIVAAILGTFMGKPDWERTRAVDRRTFGL